MTDKIKIEWEDFHYMSKKIISHYKDKGITRIVGISRGGLPLAVVLSNALDIPMIPIIWQTRDGDIKEDNRIRDIGKSGVENTLFIDDICDSGETIDQIRSIIPDSRWCTLVTKKWNKVEFSPLDKVGDERWITFPWDKNKYMKK